MRPMRKKFHTIPLIDATVTSEAEIWLINALVHDYWFDVDQIRAHVVGEVAIHLFSDRASRSEPGRSPDAILFIGNVRKMTLDDSQKVGYYDINTVAYKRPVVTISTGIPLLLSFEVSDLNLRLTTRPHNPPRGYCLGVIALSILCFALSLAVLLAV